MSVLPSLLRLPRRLLDERPIFWRLPIIAGVLILAAGINYIVTGPSARMILILILGMIAGVAGLLVLWRWPAVGLVMIIPANMFVSFAVGTGSETGINATVLLIIALLGFWLFDLIAVRRELKLVESRTFLPLFIFIGVAALAFISGQLPWFVAVSSAPLTAQLGGLAVFALSAGAFLLAAHLIREMVWLERLVWTFLVLGAVFIIIRIVPGMFRSYGALYQWGSTSSQFWTWLAAISLSQALINRRLRPQWRAALFLLFAGTIYVALVMTYDWKSGWIPPLIATAVIVSLRSWKLGALLIMGGLLLGPTLLSSLVASDEYSYSTRVDAWLILLEIIKINPLLGLGPANYYFYTPQYEIRGYQVSFNSHNQYLDIIAQLGFLGLLPLLWFFGEVGRLGWSLRQREPGGFAQAYVYGALGGFVATVVSGMLGDWMLPFVYNVGIVGMRSSVLGWLFLGALVAVDHMTRQSRTATA
jgi:hypothetical protein